MNSTDKRSRSRIYCFIALLTLSIVPRTVLAENWPQFRGPTGQGHSAAENLPVTWGGPENENVLWKAPLTGNGFASPIVWGDRVFVCTARWPDEADTPEKRKALIAEHHLLCFQLSDGRQLWDTQIPPGPWKWSDLRGSYASPTPATDGKQIYVVFGSSVIAALDFEGQIVWRHEITPYSFDVAIGSSPVLFEDSVIMLCAMANKKDSSVIAYDQRDGSIRWKQPLPSTGFGHSTPLLIEVDGKPQLIIVASGSQSTAAGVQSLDPADGSIIWTCTAAGDASSAAFGSGILYSDSGRGGPGVAIDPTGTGDVSATHIKWKVDHVPEAIGSPLIVDGLVYRLQRPNVLKCWQAGDGQEVYTQRLDRLTTTWASPVVDARGRIYVASAGVSYVVQSGREFKVLGTNDLGDPNHASPAVAGDKMILVGTRSVYCIGKN